MTEEGRQPHHLELFAGGVPPFSSLQVDFYRFNRIIEAIPDEGEDGRPLISWTADVCLIALVAHFEAFCKDLYAATINICPEVLERFTAKRPDSAIAVADLVQVDLRMDRNLGFLVAQRLDFGSPRKINSAYEDLLGITPLSKSRIEKLEELLDLRNLLVHHGGIYTSSFARQHGLPKTEQYQLFHQGPELFSADFLKWEEFIRDVAVDMTRASHKALSSLVEEQRLELEPFQRHALDYLMVDIDRGWQDVYGDTEKDFKEPNKGTDGDEK